jgi:hypothetical protein
MAHNGISRLILSCALFLLLGALPCPSGLAQEPDKGNNKAAPPKAIAAYIQPARMEGLVKTMALRKVFNTHEEWRATAYGVRSDGKDGRKWGPARLCFTSGPSLEGGYCYEAKDGNDVYETVDGMSLVPINNDKGPPYALYFVAQGAHNRRLASLWTYRKEEKKFVNIVPPLAYAYRAGGCVFLPDVAPDRERLIVVADSAALGYMGAGQAFFCAIRVLRYSDKTRRFEPVGSGYTTTTRYEYTPIGSEMENIKKYLAGTLPSPVPEGTLEEDSAAHYFLADTLPLGRVFNISKKWQATAYEYFDPSDIIHEESVGPPPKLCFSGPDGESCFEARMETRDDKHEYNSAHELSLVPIFSDREPAFGVLFVADGAAYLHDLGNLVTLWTYNKEKKKFFNLLPPLHYPTALGSFALLSDIRPGMEGIFAIANYIWGKEEGLGLDSDHRYKISLYRYSPKSGRFEPTGSFVTRKKYNDSTLDFIFHREMKGIEKLAGKK